MTDSLPKNETEKLTGKERSIANLRPIKPGEVRNPTGGKKAPRIPDLLRRIGDEMVTYKDGQKISKLEAVMRKVYQEAIAGRSWAVQLIAERMDGKVPLKLENNGNKSALCIVLDSQAINDPQPDPLDDVKDITGEIQSIEKTNDSVDSTADKPAETPATV